MRYIAILFVALIAVLAGAISTLFRGALQIAPGARPVSQQSSGGVANSPIGWKTADMRELMERNHYPCGFATNASFDFDEITESKTESTRGTVFAGAADTVTTPTARRRSRHAPADYLWCDIGAAKVAGVTVGPGEHASTRSIFVSKDGLISEFLTDTRIASP